MIYRIVIDPTQQQQEWVKLSPEQHHYLKRVLRLKDGDRLILTNGQGQTWIALIKGRLAQIEETLLESTELPINLTLMVALPKGNGFDEIVRCCTELGVTTFIPVISDRTLLNPSVQKVERWRKIALEAVEQSERQIVPQILDPVEFSQALIKVNKINTDAYICVTRKEAKHLLAYLQKPIVNNLIIATGPEGGWTSKEVEQAQKSGFYPVTLGYRILRAITAPICAISLVTGSIESQN